MKKIALSLILTSLTFVSCKETTDKVENTIDSTKTEVNEKIETVTDSVTNTVDSTAAALKEAVKVELKKVDE
ncbi:hypothetical protein NAT47_00895 [Flavobacterium sp. HXWNR69]|uniref:Lipoprotein n=1 Tax=Flavobacterium fragile TaxID=2949085 RepID=A0ABT0TDC7_9FLAO|nr:hypothetical protein [Flavobacterium sp. HXWNR69]MCL9768966.1 hypothetical protein [Flavobacterium sp. HXWNR69]